METDIYLNDQIKQLEKQMREIDEKLTRMLMMLTGNVLDKNDTGFIGKVNDLESRMEKLEKFRDKAVYLIIGASLTTGFGISKVIELLMK